MDADKTNYDLLYNPRLVVKDYQEIFDRWGKHSERARASLDCYLDVPYGSSEAEKMDIFRAQGKSRGLLIYIHGGYWRSLDKKRFSFVAPALGRGARLRSLPRGASRRHRDADGASLRVAVP
jgi:arylformamidase